MCMQCMIQYCQSTPYRLHLPWVTEATSIYRSYIKLYGWVFHPVDVDPSSECRMLTFSLICTSCLSVYLRHFYTNCLCICNACYLQIDNYSTTLPSPAWQFGFNSPRKANVDRVLKIEKSQIRVPRGFANDRRGGVKPSHQHVTPYLFSLPLLATGRVAPRARFSWASKCLLDQRHGLHYTKNRQGQVHPYYIQNFQ